MVRTPSTRRPMRVFFLLPAAVLLCTIAVTTTPPALEGQLLTIGAKGGVTFASLADPDGTFDDVGRRTGSVFGGFAAIGAGALAVRGEVLLVQKGFDATSDQSNVVFNVDYVEVPLLLMARFGTGPVKPSIYGGVAVGFERSCTISSTGLTVVAEGDCDRPEIEVERETMDAGAVFGAEVMFGLGGLSLVVDGRYTMGLTTLDASDDPDELKNRAFMLMAGLAVPIG